MTKTQAIQWVADADEDNSLLNCSQERRAWEAELREAFTALAGREPDSDDPAEQSICGMWTWCVLFSEKD